MKEKYIVYLVGNDNGRCDYSQLGCNQQMVLIEVDDQKDLLKELFQLVIGDYVYNSRDDEYYWERGYDWESSYGEVTKDLLNSVEVFKVECFMGDYLEEMRRMRDNKLSELEKERKLTSEQRQEEKDRLEFERLKKKFHP